MLLCSTPYRDSPLLNGVKGLGFQTHPPIFPAGHLHIYIYSRYQASWPSQSPRTEGLKIFGSLTLRLGYDLGNHPPLLTCVSLCHFSFLEYFASVSWNPPHSLRYFEGATLTHETYLVLLGQKWPFLSLSAYILLLLYTLYSSNC